jgi:hypothetical protein
LLEGPSHHALYGAGQGETVHGSRFLYDRVSRLKEAHVKTAPTATGAEVWQAYRFDGFGNLLSASGMSAYNTPTDPQTNRLTAANFDSRGNQRSWAGAAHTWNALNQLENTVNGSENWFHVSTASEPPAAAASTRTLWARRGLDLPRCCCGDQFCQ